MFQGSTTIAKEKRLSSTQNCTCPVNSLDSDQNPHTMVYGFFPITSKRRNPLPYPQEMGKKSGGQGMAGGELELIRQIRRRAGAGRRDANLRLGIGDDCALIRPADGEELAITTDLSIAGRHFRLDWHPPEAVGHRTLARGLSDLAAMGARPVAAFLSLGLPGELTVADRDASWVQRFLDGFFALAQACKTPLAGGDLAESPVALADIVLVGAVPRGKALLRSRARPGDLLYVTGSLGAAAAGLAKLKQLAGQGDHGRSVRALSPLRQKLAHGGGTQRAGDTSAVSGDLVAPHLFPQPRIEQGLGLRRRALATAAIDLSDGLSTDLIHLCEESGVSATLQRDLLPVADGASLDQALNGGEDYELLFAARPKARVPRSIAGVPITRIGCITERAARDPVIMVATGRIVEPLEGRGWEHFSEP
jgi:thiamine-monophosphate kinase